MPCTCPLIQEKTIEANSDFDTYNGQKLLVDLRQYRVPPSNWLGPMPSGDLWTSSFRSPCGGFTHEGGWCWHENKYPDWASRVNWELFMKRGGIGNLDNYVFLTHTKQKARRGDILYVKVVRGEMHDLREGYALIHKDWQFLAKVKGDVTGDYSSEQEEFVLLEDAAPYSRVVPTEEGYRQLPDYSRKEWRKIHGIKGAPKFL